MIDSDSLPVRSILREARDACGSMNALAYQPITFKERRKPRVRRIESGSNRSQSRRCWWMAISSLEHVGVEQPFRTNLERICITDERRLLLTADLERDGRRCAECGQLVLSRRDGRLRRHPNSKNGKGCSGGAGRAKRKQPSDVGIDLNTVQGGLPGTSTNR
jgi:hypothetical protein